MISCLLIKIGRNLRGLPIRSERSVEGEILRIGRSAECSIHLLDHRISLHHAHIRSSLDGKLYIDSENAAMNIDGSLVQSAELVVGMQIRLGPYQLIVEALPEPNHLSLSYELLQPQHNEVAELKSWQPSSLVSKWISKRRIAWLMLGMIVLGCMLLPILQATSPQVRHLLKSINLNPHQIWSSGVLSNAHRRSNANCMDCHKLPFQSVSNSACLKCHAETLGHGRHQAGQHDVLGSMDCTQCHSEHQGGHAMPNRSEGECISCHANIKRYQAGSKLPDIRDFGIDHPDFKLSIRTGINYTDVRHVPQLPDKSPISNGQPRENSALKFSHQKHIGLVQVPWDMNNIKDMKCVNCHQQDEPGQRFKPVSFKQHCFECHQDQLEFSPVEAGRKLPHGSTSELSATLTDYYAGLAFKTNQTQAWLNAQLTKVTKQLSENDGCAYCHVTKPATDTGHLFEVAPLLMTQHWFPFAKFPHAKHATSKCVDCHNVEESDDSADIIIPNKQSCLQCHTGMSPHANKVGSPCMSCHNFHSAAVKKALSH